MRHEPILSPRALNRATLARQHLLQRSDMAPLALIEHLVGLQAQESNPPYFGLWSRLQGFKIHDLTQLLEQRLAVRCALQRGTLHVLAAGDLLALRPLFQAALARMLVANHGKKLAGADTQAVAEAGRALLLAQALDSTQLGQQLAGLWPDAEPASLAVAVRCHEALVQLPPAGTWEQHRNALLLPADLWLGQPLAAQAELDPMLLRYLAAFGPASAQDAAVWCGLALTGPQGINAALERLAPRLCRYRDEAGRLLFDLVGTALPAPDTPAPVRLVAGYDNLLLSHADRSRLFDAAMRPRIFTVNGQVRPTLLLDGFIQGTWKMASKGRQSVLEIVPFRRLSRRERQETEAEALLALDFAAPEATSRKVQFAAADA